MEREPLREVSTNYYDSGRTWRRYANDPVREVTQFWSRKGELLAENDPHLDRG